MNPEQIAALLQKTVESVLKTEKPASHAQTSDNSVVANALADVAKAVSSINTRLDTLEKVAVKHEPETPETQIEKLAKTVQAIAEKVDNIGKPAIPEEEKPIESLTLKTLTETIQKVLAAGKPQTPASKKTPKGQGKEQPDETSVEKTTGTEEIDLTGVEEQDVAGNTLTKKQREDRAVLDMFLAKRLSGSSEIDELEIDGDDDDSEE